MKRYGLTIVVMAIILGALFGAERWSAGWIERAEDKVRDEDQKNKNALIRDQRLALDVKTSKAPRAAMQAFIRDWTPYVQPFPKDADFIASSMAIIERHAQAAGVATSGKTTPGQADYQVSGRVVKVQPLSITVTGDLRRCLTWLGAVEESLAYMRVEGFEISGYGAQSAALRVSMVHPVPAAGAAPAAGPAAPTAPAGGGGGL